MLKLDAVIHIPGTVMDHTYVVLCDCGVNKPFGYMGITADRWADRHRDIGPSHNVTVEATDAPPLTRATIKKRIDLRWRANPNLPCK